MTVAPTAHKTEVLRFIAASLSGVLVASETLPPTSRKKEIGLPEGSASFYLGRWKEALPPVHPELGIRSSPLTPGAEALRSTGSDKRKRFPIGCGANELERHRRRAESAGRAAVELFSWHILNKGRPF